MNRDESVAYVNAMTACAMIEAMGLHAENMSKAANGATFGFNGPNEFNALIEKYGIHHNAVLTTFQQSL